MLVVAVIFCMGSGGGSYGLVCYRLAGLVVKASTSRAEDLRFESRSRRDFFPGRVIPVTSKLALQLLPCQAPGIIGSALGLVVMAVVVGWRRRPGCNGGVAWKWTSWL